MAHQAPAPATTDCYTSQLGLSDCLTYVEEGSNLTKPDNLCWPELARLVKGNSVCLCYLLANSSSNLGWILSPPPPPPGEGGGAASTRISLFNE
ncbi:non-specific lipid transfer protein GPI-anchored 2-like [Pyrus ussuriensis x Pyrus communis]|uniref:Non-specific lipid transfer protein GPI-anchored 2-like n=1 Tax=Pyrus ussuriensis x Pyrus communis TaxID=2448454 RepID=A0A5N5G406_9ROSA|nr:non-specific lipid transfer protein GPI-anchored 2-like [Pyrus ussuriensis x Pyrus communis]